MNEDEKQCEDTGSSIISQSADALESSLTGIPTPIRKNALKAFGQLCTALVDIPVAYLEGVATEKRADTQARVKIIETMTSKMSEQMDVPNEYAQVAVQKFGQRILREQINLENISRQARIELKNNNLNSSHSSEEVSEISEDWLNTFEQEASKKSSNEMQLLFAKILAGEITNPSSYSIRTIKLISQLDNQAAKLFQIFCSLSVSLEAEKNIIDARVVSLKGNAASNSLQEYGLSFGALNILQEYGLIISDYNSYMDYDMCIVSQNNSVVLPFLYQNQSFALRPKDLTKKNSARLNGVALSNAGRELLNVVDKTENENYTKALKQYFENRQFDLAHVNLNPNV